VDKAGLSPIQCILLPGFEWPDLSLVVLYTLRPLARISTAAFSRPQAEGFSAIWFIPQCETKFCKIDRDAKK
jgi:hypothetical protein